jgi:hypothetical protein
MIEMKCPGCGAGGRIPRDKLNTRLVCKKCLKVFHMSPGGKPVLGEPPAAKDAPKEKARRESSGGGGIEFGGGLDLSGALSKIKLPQVSAATAGISALVVLIAAAGIWFFARQSLAQRADLVARAVMSPDAVKTVVDVSVPETVIDVIKWHSKVSLQYGDLKMALGGLDAGLIINVLADSSGGPGVAVAQFSAEGTRLGTAGVDAIHPIPSRNTASTKLELKLYFLKDSFGNWLLDGKRTLEEAKD